MKKNLEVDSHLKNETKQTSRCAISGTLTIFLGKNEVEGGQRKGMKRGLRSNRGEGL